MSGHTPKVRPRCPAHADRRRRARAAGVFSWWITQCARLWIAVTAGTRFTAPAMAFVLASGCVVLWGWFCWWQDTGAGMAVDGMHVDGWRQAMAQFFPGPSSAHWGMFGAILVVWLNAGWLVHPVILAAQVLLFLVPISAWLLHPLAVAYDVRHEAFTGAVWLRDPPPVRRILPAVAAAVVGAAFATLLGRLLGSEARFVRASAGAGAGPHSADMTSRVRLTRAALITWRVVASAIVAMVAVVAVHVGMSQSSSAASVADSSEVTREVGVITGSTSTAAPAVHQLQVTYWYDYGGHDLLMRIIGNFRQLSSAADAAAKNGGQVDPAAFNPLCSQGLAITADADAYFPVPDSTLQPLWSTAIAATAKAGHDCLRAPAAQNGNAFIQALREFTGTGAPLTAFENQIKAFMPAAATPAPATQS
jgi:hypothetical protein